MRPHRVVLLSVLLLVAAACGSKSPSNLGASEGEHRYAVLREDAWRLQEAVGPRAGDSVSSVERPALDWYAEYVPKNSSSGGTLRLSGHRATFHRVRSELEDLGFDLDEVDVGNWTGVGGSTAETGSRPTLVLLDHGSSSLTLLSYDLELEALTQLAAHVKSVDETAWTDAGGVVR